ncbi:MAG: DEAD/DEAH box helicase [Rhodoplanes sp.]|uniref:DEAD/DEAH box helicase n=1 Tax=Rhodoplanes sp. TaxID=1968906 RepID=UPI0017D95F16|nr:DEAD/DEAH box helicase [Rhodoplanes sp.]NVO12686.1 DEAD/DEAH box helicase [Rhodoplanes sp.]
MSFDQLGLSEKVLAAVTSAGYTAPTPIQEQAIPHVLARRDVLGIAQTGTGKTAAFVLPMLTKLETGRARARMPRTLILEPTRELAAQVEESFIKYGKNHKLNVALLIGGVSFGNQDTKLTRGVDVLIATPGRLLDHTERGGLLLTGVELLVIDEADRMLDMGFIPDIERICKLVPFTRQTLFFTATMPAEIRRITEQFLHNPVKVEVSRPATTVDAITQSLVKAGREPHDKREVLRRLIRQADGLKNAIVFCNRKRDVATLHRSLLRHKFSAIALHGDMDQSARTAALDQFRKGEIAILVASDVAARGLDIPDVSHIFNFDVPHHPDDYVHRIGRTGRAGRSGTAITIVTSAEQKSVVAIEKLIGRTIEWQGAPHADDPAEDDGPREPVRMGARMPRRGREGQGRDRHSGERQGGERQGGERHSERTAAEGEHHGRERQGGERQGGERQGGERQGRDGQRDRTAKPAHGAPRTKPGNVTPIEAVRRRTPRDEAPDDIESYLPAFLLRPVRVKA